MGKKTYILAAIGVTAIWADHFFGIGLSDACKAAATAADAVCTISTADAIKATWAAIMAVTIRAGIGGTK